MIKDVKGFEGLYAITDDGKVWSYKYNKFLKPCKDGKDYLYVTLCKNGKKHNHKIHRLVAEAFLSNPNGYETIDHIDNNKENNCVDNLQFMSRIDNNSKEHPHQAPIKIRCVETGETFDSLMDCKRKTGCCHLSEHLRGKRMSVNGLHFERIGD